MSEVSGPLFVLNCSPDDRRVAHVELTEEGRAGLPRMRELPMEVLEQFLRGFSHDEVRQLGSYLTRLLMNARIQPGMIRIQPETK
jgi:DNA-binding MarR family transcriptional regulator